jgi:nitric oxide synthase oxygenase domain/subunit
MSTLLLIGLVAAAAGFIYWAYTTLVGNASVKDTVESLTVEKAVETLKTEAKKDLDLNKDGKVDLGDAVEGVKKAKTSAKKAVGKVKTAVKKTKK